MVFDSKSSHTTYHNCLKNSANVTLTRVDNIWHCETIESNKKINNGWICPICGGVMKSRQAKMCMLCSQKKRAENIPSKHQLASDREKLHSFCAIGRKYNVSDNAVRRWFKKYNLPL